MRYVPVAYKICPQYYISHNPRNALMTLFRHYKRSHSVVGCYDPAEYSRKNNSGNKKTHLMISGKVYCINMQYPMCYSHALYVHQYQSMTVLEQRTQNHSIILSVFHTIQAQGLRSLFFKRGFSTQSDGIPLPSWQNRTQLFWLWSHVLIGSFANVRLL